MAGWHEGALAGFDIESTSVDTETARIVTAAVIRRSPEGTPADSTWLVDPGTEIPAEATAIHGITTERARAEGSAPPEALAGICEALTAVLAGRVPLVVYNAPYDLTVLDRETRRHGLEPFADILRRHGGLIVDPYVLDKHADPYRRGRRTLAAACQHYGVPPGTAHDSGADAIAAMRVAWKIAARYPAIAALSPDELHELQVQAKADHALSFQGYLMRQGKPEVIDGSWPFRQYEQEVA